MSFCYFQRNHQPTSRGVLIYLTLSLLRHLCLLYHQSVEQWLGSQRSECFTSSDRYREFRLVSVRCGRRLRILRRTSLPWRAAKNIQVNCSIRCDKNAVRRPQIQWKITSTTLQPQNIRIEFYTTLATLIFAYKGPQKENILLLHQPSNRSLVNSDPMKKWIKRISQYPKYLS